MRSSKARHSAFCWVEAPTATDNWVGGVAAGELELDDDVLILTNEEDSAVPEVLTTTSSGASEGVAVRVAADAAALADAGRGPICSHIMM